jgi:hypothetical protein
VRSEIQLQARLSHVNVVELKQVWWWQGGGAVDAGISLNDALDRHIH